MHMRFENTTSYMKGLRTLFAQVAHKRPYQEVVLGRVHGQDIVLYQPTKMNVRAHNILIAAGFHGNEPAGPLAVLEYLKEVSAEELHSANISFMPLVNPTGFALNTRENIDGDDPNRGFPHSALPFPKDPMSAEGKILYAQRYVIGRAAESGFISLHEYIDDEDTEDENVNDDRASYLFTYEPSDNPGKFSLCLRDAQKNYYRMKNGVADDGFPEIVMVDGLAYNAQPFNCFEDLLKYDVKIQYIATTETVGSDLLSRRTACNHDIINAFVKNFKL